MATKTPEQRAKEAIVQEVMTNGESAKDKRTQWEAWVATISRFEDGDHRTWFDDRGRQQTKELEEGEIWRTINLFPGALDIRMNRLTRNDPRWFVKESPGIEASPEDIDAANAYLQLIYRTENWKDKIKQVSHFGDTRGLCYAIVGWEDGKATLDYYDPWDIYPDPNGTCLEDIQWLIVSVPKSIEWIKNNDMYDEKAKSALEADHKHAMSGLKNQWLRERASGNGPTGTVLLHQYFKVEGKKVMLYHVAGEHVLSEKQLPYKKLSDFIDVFMPRKADTLYPRPICSDWVDPQKTVNKIYSSIESYIDVYLHGRWRRIDKTVRVPVGGAHGQIINAAIGEIDQFPMNPLPQTHFQHLEQALRQFEQVAGVHSESLGRLSGGAVAGVAIAELQAADEQNSAAAVDNLRTFLSRIGKKVLKVTAANLKIVTPVFTEAKPGESVRLDVIGEDAYTMRDVDAVPIKAFDNVEVEVILGSAYSELQKQNTIKELFQFYRPGENSVTDRIVLENWNVGSQREVAKQLEELRDPDRLIATGENEKMRLGEFVTMNASDKHDIHIQVHQIEQKRMQELGDQRGLEMVMNHIEEHQEMLQLGRRGVQGGTQEFAQQVNEQQAEPA